MVGQFEGDGIGITEGNLPVIGLPRKTPSPSDSDSMEKFPAITVDTNPLLSTTLQRHTQTGVAHTFWFAWCRNHILVNKYLHVYVHIRMSVLL